MGVQNLSYEKRWGIMDRSMLCGAGERAMLSAFRPGRRVVASNPLKSPSALILQKVVRLALGL